MNPTLFEWTRSAWRRVVLAEAIILASVGVAPPVAAEEDRARCIEAYEASQQLRQEGKLRAARGELLVCVQQSCPDFVRPDCLRWLGEVREMLPTIVVAAKGRDGADLTDVSVYVDGERVAETLDGRALPIDPGPHELRFEQADAPPKSMSIVVQQGVKNRMIAVSWAPEAPPEPATPPPEPKPAVAPPPERGQPVLAYVLGGLGVAAMGSFAAFGILGKNEADELDDRCGEGAPPGGVCTQDEIDAARTKLIVADVSLGVGAGLLAASLGLFIYHFVSEPDDATSAIRFDVSPLGASPAQGLVSGGLGRVTIPF